MYSVFGYCLVLAYGSLVCIRFSQLQLEIRMYPAKARSNGWGWIGLAVVVTSVAAAGVLIGYLVERRRRIRSPHAEMQPSGYS